MFVLGGEEKGKYLGHCFSYNFLTLSFTSCASMLEAKVNFGSIYFKEHIFAVGGWKQFYSKKCEMYRLEDDKWIDIPSLSNEREGITLCVVQDRYIYAFGNVTTRGKRFRSIGGNDTSSSKNGITAASNA